MKALVPSTILTLIVAAIVGPNGSNGSFLTLESMRVAGYSFYWSWPFFLTVMTLNCILITRIVRDVRV
ncbi:MAG: hypothetical protein WCY29_05300 [Novosphingobium sp.]